MQDVSLNQPITSPPLLTRGRMVGLSTAARPTAAEDGSELQPGAEYLEDDTGRSWCWDGSAWQQTTLAQKLAQGVELLFEIRDLLEGDVP